MRDLPESYHSNTKSCAICKFAKTMAPGYNLRCTYGLKEGEAPTREKWVRPYGTCDHFIKTEMFSVNSIREERENE